MKRAQLTVRCDDDVEAKALLDQSSALLRERVWQVTFDLGKERCFFAERRRAAELLKRARQAFESMLFSEAKRDAEAVVQLFEGAEASFGALDVLVDARLLLGWIALDGDPKETREQLRVAAALAPALQPSKQIYPPTFIAAFEAARESLSGRSGTLHLESEPAGAAVLLDGVERCRSPCSVDNVPEGTHFLELRADEHGADRRLVSVGRSSEQHISMSLARIETRRMRNAVLVRLATRDDGAAVGATLTGATPEAHAELTLEVTDRQASAQQLVEAIERVASNTLALAAAPPLPIYEQWWFWGAVAAGVATLTVSAVLMSGGDTARVVIVPP